MFRRMSESAVSVNAAANLLGVHTSTVARWIMKGVRGRKLPSLLIGGRRYIQTQELEAFINLPAQSTETVNQNNRQRASAAQQQLAAYGLGAVQSKAYRGQTPKANGSDAEECPPAK